MHTSVLVCVYFLSLGSLFLFQGKGLQKTYWLDGRRDLSLPLLSSQVDVRGNEPAPGVQTTDDD